MKLWLFGAMWMSAASANQECIMIVSEKECKAAYDVTTSVLKEKYPTYHVYECTALSDRIATLKTFETLKRYCITWPEFKEKIGLDDNRLRQFSVPELDKKGI
jgi:hypothetical protein